LCAADRQLHLLGIFDPAAAVERFAGLPVTAQLETLGPYDAIVITDFRNPQETFDNLVRMAPPARVIAPSLLAISRQRPTLADDGE